VRFGERKPDQEDAIARKAIKSLGSFHRVDIEDSAIVRILTLHRRYTPYSGFPGKTIHFFESLVMQHSAKPRRLSLKDAIESFCNDTGMPQFLVDDDFPFSPNKTVQYFNDRVIGQHDAIDELVNGITQVKTRMARSGKPILSGLFVGPTGVGKTEIVKTLAQYMFGERDRMIRLDMSEYSDAYSVLRLTTSSEASLVSKVRQQPFSIVLLDEIEKADSSFYDLLLQILDEGRLTDDKGEIANFCSTIVVMTSNIGAQEFASAGIGFTDATSDSTMQAHFSSAVSKHFRPELVNRIDLIVPFATLTKAETLAVIRKEVALLKLNPGIVSRNVTISVDEKVYSLLANNLSSSKYGARAVQRELQKIVTWPLSEVLSAHAENEPLNIKISVINEKVSIKAIVVTAEKKHRVSLLAVADDAALLRKSMQALENSSTWVGILSRLDQLDAIKSKQKEKFWKNPEWFNEHETNRQLTESLASCLLAVYEIEEQSLGHFRDQQLRAAVDLFYDAINNSRKSFEKLLVELDSVVNPEHNEAALSFYGPHKALDIVEAILKDCLDKLDLESSMLYHYVRTSSDAVTENAAVEKAVADDGNEQSSLKPDANVTMYTTSKHPANKPKHTLIGKSLVLSAPAVALYFLHESGIWKLAKNNINALLYIDLHIGNPVELCIPDDVHRKQFYQGNKPDRHITDNNYQDKRILQSGLCNLSDHAEAMAITRMQALRRIHLNEDSKNTIGFI